MPRKEVQGKTVPKGVYSRIGQIPSGWTDGRRTPGCLVLEGGAFRGIYTAGVLDVLMQSGINFEAVIGVSAGALNGMGYVAGQIGRSARTLLQYRHDPQYVGVIPMIRDKGVIGFHFMFEEMNKIEPLDEQRLMDPGRRFVAVATALTTGMPVYFEKKDDLELLYQSVKASASMPYVSQPVLVRGIRCLDGGCSVKVPFEWAMKEGYRKIVVVRTRDRLYHRTAAGMAGEAAETFYPEFPEFCRSLSRMDAEYKRECEALLTLHDQGRLFMVAPSLPVTVGRLETDMEKLGDLYWQGVYDMHTALPELRAYLQS